MMKDYQPEAWQQQKNRLQMSYSQNFQPIECYTAEPVLRGHF